MGGPKEDQCVLLVLGGHVSFHQQQPAVAAWRAQWRRLLWLPGRGGAQWVKGPELYQPSEWQPVWETRLVTSVFVCLCVFARAWVIFCVYQCVIWSCSQEKIKNIIKCIPMKCGTSNKTNYKLNLQILRLTGETVIICMRGSKVFRPPSDENPLVKFET